MKVFALFFLLLTKFAFSQEEWGELAHFSLTQESVWQVDLLGNLYIADKDLLVKYDTSGVKQYSQSLKSEGRINAILPINTMKIVLFSEQQQSFTIYDNTLSEANKTHDLSEMGFGFVTLIAVSSQPNKFWVYDQLNSKLILLDLNRSNQQQDIANLRGLLNSYEIRWMKEDANKLYLYDGKEKVFVFDLYGSLLEVYDLPEAEQVELCNKEMFIVKNGSVFRYRKEDKSYEKINAPISGVSQFQWVNSQFYFRVKDELLKFSLYL